MTVSYGSPCPFGPGPLRYPCRAEAEFRGNGAALTGDLDAAAAHNEAARAVAAQIGAVSTTGMYYAFLNELAL